MTSETDGQKTQAEIIAEQNDIFRASFGADARVPGRIVATQGVDAMGGAFMARLAAAVQAFDGFGPDNDPHQQHDFGAVEIDGTTVWFKIDLYGPDYEFGTENPTSAALTRRVLTLLLPSEY